MPIVQIHIMEGRDDIKKARLVQGVTDAIVESLGVPADAVRIMLSEMAPNHYAIAGKLMKDQKK
ncbi:MAG: 2-hydroxymuconate tautomerase family protein [Rickettsiales bacterium]|nr:2-hydroxymuconate tautomerase family protein [Rickettsiales bacterium]